ncbi:MAG: hypothetical protein WA705_01135 [Candidatus Ozemobacteraceae bacterium]
MLILALAVLPLIRSFSQSQALAKAQIEHEIGLKIAEAVLNAALSGDFLTLDEGSAVSNASIPLRLELPNQLPIQTSIPMTGPGQGKTFGSTGFRIGPTDFQISIECDPLFGQSPTTAPLVFTFADGPARVAAYSCPPEERVIRIRSSTSWVSNGIPQKISLETCRARLSK